VRTKKIDSNDRKLLKFDMKPEYSFSQGVYRKMFHPQSLAFAVSVQAHI
jgi:hypothetical protein